MKKAIDPTTGKIQEASRNQWIYQFYRNYEKLIDYFLEKANGYLKCFACDDKANFLTKSGLVNHFRFNKKHVVEFAYDNLEEI